VASDDAETTRALIEAAERAAAAGDHATAARHLRDVVAVHERELGPSHPDLANTLNNLGVVLERASQPADAEAAYRRAYAIAREAFDADHPFVATSEANLREFCETRGVPFEVAPPVDVDPAPPAEAAAIAVPVPAPRRSFPVAAGIGLGVVAAVVIGWLITRPAPSGVAPSASKPEVEGPASGAGPAPAPPATGRLTLPAPASPSRDDSARRGASPRIEVVRAEICRTLSTASSVGPDWPCETTGDTVRPGTLSFYTRLRSSLPTTVEHRWYRGRSLEQRVQLRVAANDRTGYRTYSRNTIGADRTGEWRVELRSEDNALLHEERFVVRIR